MVLVNGRNVPTFSRYMQKSYIDVTPWTDAQYSNLTDWMVKEDETNVSFTEPFIMKFRLETKT